MEIVPEEEGGGAGEEGMICSACDLKMWRWFDDSSLIINDHWSLIIHHWWSALQVTSKCGVDFHDRSGDDDDADLIQILRKIERWWFCRFNSDFKKKRSAQNYLTTNLFLCPTHDGLFAKMSLKFTFLENNFFQFSHRYCDLPDCPWHEPRPNCRMRRG